MLSHVNTTIFLILIAVSASTSAFAQGEDGWRWQADGNVFAGVNYQSRAFTDFSNVESQNWFMGTGRREAKGGTIAVAAMLSLEPFTMKKIGSAQVFQTGETFDNQPLVDYQHPHDLISELGASYSRDVNGWRLTTSASAVGSPALGPIPYMHRPSAAENPQAPLSHHYLDSTHATPGVVTVQAEKGDAVIASSWFRGREPDERRTDIDFGALDSWSVRGSMRRGRWEAQASGGRLKNPDFSHPGDVTRLTASVGHSSSGAIATTIFAAWGENRETLGPRDAFLFESQISWLGNNYLYSRAELVTKDIIDGQPLSRIGAFTLGYTRDVTKGMRSRLGIGGDITMYSVPANLKESYGAPVSFHIFARFRFTTSAMLAGMTHHH